MPTKNFRILSLNGGGVRALFQAQYLHSLSTRHNLGNFWEEFDLIIGTSAGAMVAAALWNGIAPDKIAKFLKVNAADVFPGALWKGIGIYLGTVKVGNSFSREPLKAKLEELLGKETLLGQRNKPYLAITATELEYSDIRVFSPITAKIDENLRLVDVVMASAALPGAYSHYEIFDPIIQEDRHYIDGGLWANAPLLAAVVLAVDRCGVSPKNIRVVSIGTAASQNMTEPDDYKNLIVNSAEFFETLFYITLHAAEKSSYEAVLQLIGSKNVLHIDGVTEQEIKAWEVNDAIKKLPRLADKIASDSKITNELKHIIGAK